MPEFRSKPVTITADQWFANGDHPEDGVGEPAVDPGTGETYERVEGAVVRFFRLPDVPGDGVCGKCNRIFHDHGYLDTAQGGHMVCPGDWITPEPNRPGQFYPIKPDVFEHRWEAIS